MIIPAADECDGWELLDSTVGFKNFLTINLDRYKAPNGRVHTFDIIKTNDASVVLALTPEEKVVVVRQFRPGPQRVCYELPGGYTDEGEDPAVAAARELLEETGYTGDNPEYAGFGFSNPYATNAVHVYVIRNVRKTGEQHLDESECLSVEEITQDELLHCLDSGAVSQTASILLAFRYLEKQKIAKQQ